MNTTHEKSVLSIEEAGRIYFGLGRSAAYQAAKRGEIPVLRFGRRLMVPRAAVERMLEQAAQPNRVERAREAQAR